MTVAEFKKLEGTGILTALAEFAIIPDFRRFSQNIVLWSLHQVWRGVFIFFLMLCFLLIVGWCSKINL